PDGSLVFGLVRDEGRTELVRWHPGRMSAPEPIAALASEGHDLSPALSPDGRTLFFATDRAYRGGGGFDVWCATVRGGEVFAPRPLPETISTAADETDPVVDPATGELVFVRRAESLDARGTLSLWTAPLDGSADARPLLPLVDGAPAALDREPDFSADGRVLFFVRQTGFGRPALMRAWRHAGRFTSPVALPLALHDGVLRGPVLRDGGRALRLVDADAGLLYRAQAVEVMPWWEGQAWIERLLLITLVLAALLWLLLALGKRWRALDIVTWCLITSLLLHVLVLLWLRGVEIVRRYQNPPPRLGEIEVSLVASGSSVEEAGAPTESTFAHQLRFSGHAQAIAPDAPTSRVAAAHAEARAADGDARLDVPDPAAHEPARADLADAAAAAEPRSARSAEHTLQPAASGTVTPARTAASARRAAPSSEAAFAVEVPAADPRGEGVLTAAAPAPAGARANALPAANEPRPAPTGVADAAPTLVGRAGAAPDPGTAVAPAAVPELTAAAPHAAPSRSAPAESAPESVARPGSLVAHGGAVSAPQASAAPGALPPASAEAARPRAVEVADRVEGPKVAQGQAEPRALAALSGEALAPADGPRVPAARASAPAERDAAVGPAPGSLVAAVTRSAPPAASREARAVPEARRVAPPTQDLRDAGAAAVAAGTATAPAPAVAPLAGEQVAPHAASPVAQRAGAPAASEATPTVTGPAPLLAAARTSSSPPVERAAARPAPSPSLAAPRPALREPGAVAAPPAAERVARAVPLAAAGAGSAAAPLPGPEGLLPAPARTAQEGTRDTVVAPSSVLVAPHATARAAPRRPEAPPAPLAAGPKVTLRDPPSSSPEAGTSASRASRDRLPPLRAFAPLGAPIAALPGGVAGPRRVPPDSGCADVSRGILPPGSLLPLPGPLAARAGATTVAQVPDLYRSRFGPQKVAALEKFGGTQETEAAVRKGLAYLASVQREDGGWGRRRRLHDKYGEVWVGKSALCLLAFLGAGHTHVSDTEHATTVRRSIDWLLQQQDPETGHFGETSSYSHGITTYALAECFAMTRDERLRPPVEKAVVWMLRNQNRGRDRRSHGGWGYFSPMLRPEDRFARTSVTAWMVMALKSAQMSGIAVPGQALADAEAYLWRMFDPRDGNFLYNREPSRLASAWRTLPGSTPAAVFCLLLLGADRNDQRLRTAAAWILERAPQAYRRASLDDFVLRGAGNVYFWYYGSLACFLSGGEVWSAWNEALKRALLAGQTPDGSFLPIDEYADYAGDDHRDRAYTTAMCVLSLEVYYRYFTPLVQPR
ncbi:MAG TPA: hypothetical protein VK081_14920, partial [Planctomycetota bacterium]|nr:hypothetical protein [Planctomycetota bacterium]